MKELIADFPNQLNEALNLGQKYKFIAPEKQFSNVVMTGLGGSGIGCSIIQNFLSDKSNIPLVVNKDYTLPAFVNENTLVIVCSYSGNTEETVACLHQAIKAKATIVCITSGGQVAEIAAKNNLDCITLPGGRPPRSCIGFAIVQVMFTLLHFKLTNSFEQDFKNAINLLNAEEKNIHQLAEQISKQLIDKTPVIYSATNFEAIAIRFRQQINENSKMLAWHHTIPEMNHNELVGWRDKDETKAVVILRNVDDYERVQMRMEINKKLIKKYTGTLIEIYSKGNSYWEKAFYFIHLTDWVSVYLADLHKVDAVEVRVIDELKGELATA